MLILLVHIALHSQMYGTLSTFFSTICDDDTLILHANSRRGLPQCWNNYTLFIFSLISIIHLSMQPPVYSALLTPRSTVLIRLLAKAAGQGLLMAMPRFRHVERSLLKSASRVASHMYIYVLLPCWSRGVVAWLHSADCEALRWIHNLLDEIEIIMLNLNIFVIHLLPKLCTVKLCPCCSTTTLPPAPSSYA
jgi:hypothetical protein